MTHKEDLIPSPGGGPGVTPGPGLVAPTPTPINLDKLIQQLSGSLIEDDGILSSQPGGLATGVSDIEAEIRGGTRAAAAATESKFGRLKEQTRLKVQKRIQAIRQGRVGFASNPGEIKVIEDELELSIKDLDQREQELINQGKSEEAKIIANLKFEQLEMQQKARIQRFSQILQLAGFAADVQREQRLAVTSAIQLQRTEQLIVQTKQSMRFARSKEERDSLKFRLDIASDALEQQLDLAEVIERALLEIEGTPDDRKEEESIRLFNSIKFGFGDNITDQELAEILGLTTIPSAAGIDEAFGDSGRLPGDTFIAPLTGAEITKATGFGAFFKRTFLGESEAEIRFNQLQSKLLFGEGLTPDERSEFQDLLQVKLEVKKIREEGKSKK